MCTQVPIEFEDISHVVFKGGKKEVYICGLSF